MTTVSREALYDLVWGEPVRTIARRMGVSDVWLKKCCAGAGIPVPDRGWWAKVAAGKAVIRRPLPPRSPGVAIDVRIGSDSYSSRWLVDPEAELAAPPSVAPVFVEAIEAVADRVDRSLGKVRLVRDFGAAHPLIRRALDDDEVRRLKPGDAPYRLRYTDPYFDAPFERRRLRILNSLFLALTLAGYRPRLDEPQARDVGVTIGSQNISFTLDHPKARKEADGRVRAPAEAYETLRLEIPATGDSWMDDDVGRVEDRLREIVVRLIVAGEMQYRVNAVRVYEDACRYRAEMERMLVERHAEAARLAQERATKAEADRRKALIHMVADYRTAQDVRAFVGAAVQVLDSSAATTAAVSAWAAWALEIADQIDPVRRLHVNSDATITAAPIPTPVGAAAC